MKTLVFALLAVNIITPLWIIRRFCVNRQGVEFNHLLMFTIGYLFYWIVPIGIGLSRLFETEPAMHLWYEVFDRIRFPILAIYLVIAQACYLSFAAGTILTSHWFRPKATTYKQTFFYPRLLNILLVLGLIAAGVYAFILRNELFQGYNTWDQQAEGTETRGPFVAVSVFLLSLAFVFTMKQHESSGFTAGFGKLLRNKYFACYFLVAILVLSLGGRLYFVSSLVMLLVYRTVYFQRISSKVALLTVAGVAALSGLTGLLRLKTEVSAETWLLNVLIETLFTGFSLIHFLGDEIFEWVKFPVFLFSSFINLAPTALLPDKAHLILAPEDYGYVAYSPLGALNSYFSFMINFGILGTIVFLFSFSCFLNFLKLQDKRLLFRVMYVMICGWLGFTFFRDAFFISIVKTMFQFSILTPILTVVAAQLLSLGWRNSFGRPASADEPVVAG